MKLKITKVSQKQDHIGGDYGNLGNCDMAKLYTNSFLQYGG